jgi:Spy/CpxP family protein refolding chaperone
MSETWSRRLRLLLVISLALNLFFIGAIAVSAIAGYGRMGGLLGFGPLHGPRLTGMPNPRQLRGVLDERGQEILESMLETRRDAFHANLQPMLEARLALSQAIATEPFDRAKVEAAMATLRDSEAVLHMGAQNMILELASQLDLAQRAKIAELLKPSDRWKEKRPN